MAVRKEKMMKGTERTQTRASLAEWMCRMVLLVVVLPLGLGHAGCDSSDGRNTGDVGLTRCSSCESLETYLKQSATRMLEAAYSEADGCYRIIGMPGFPENDFLAPVPGGEAQDQGDHSTTNLQEPGVDEPDFLKNDSEHVFVLNGSRFLIYDANPPDEAHELSRVDMEGIPGQMFIR
jgi:hypothetical protein